jgi:cobalt-zinc-cadmium efflux system membrane fusion protein
MKAILKFMLSVIVVAGLSLGAYVYLPASLGKAPSGGHGHGGGHGDHHDHGPQAAKMDDAKMAAAGIEIETAGPAVLRDTLQVNGVLQANQETLVQVTPRFPGVVREMRKRIGDAVAAGETIARIESNQSLTSYELKAPMAGTVIDRQLSLGEYASEQKPAFVIADLSTVWAEFAVHRRDLKRVKVGDTVSIDPEDGAGPIAAKIAYISPVGSIETQSSTARAVVANPGGRLRPGLFITGRVVLEEKPVPLAIKTIAVQMVDNRPVVYVRDGDKLEPREVELGQRDREHAEVLFGVMEGEKYATKNSFVIKAEIAKASAAHEH